MPYPTIIPLITRIDVDIWLRERLRCEYLLTDHELRPDFPPDLVLRDQRPPHVVFKDQTLENTYWAVTFGDEIVVVAWPYSTWYLNGLVLNDGYMVRMVGGEMVVAGGVPPAPYQADLSEAPFILEIINGELVYTPRPDVVLQDQASPGTFWGVRFEEEISLRAYNPPPGMRWYNGIRLAEWGVSVESGVLVVRVGGMVDPYLETLVQEHFILEIVNGELVYTPRYVRAPQGFFNMAWALYFRDEITVYPWPYITPINGIVLNNLWVLEMRAGEIVLEQGRPWRRPVWVNWEERKKFRLVVNPDGELEYYPFIAGQRLLYQHVN